MTQGAPTYKAKLPDGVKTPNVVETKRLGTLRFFDGVPDADTVKRAYDNLDYLRGVETFVNGIPATSIHALCKGLVDAYVESFNGRLRDECLNEYWFTTLADARALIEAWRRDYNEHRPKKDPRNVEFGGSGHCQIAAGDS